MKKDISVLGKGKSDPYCIVTVGAQQFKTKTIDNNCNPKWDYWCEVSLFCLQYIFMIFLKFFLLISINYKKLLINYKKSLQSPLNIFFFILFFFCDIFVVFHFH